MFRILFAVNIKTNSGDVGHVYNVKCINGKIMSVNEKGYVSESFSYPLLAKLDEIDWTERLLSYSLWYYEKKSARFGVKRKI